MSNTSTTATIVFKFRIDGSKIGSGQRDLLDRHAGAHRAAYNWALGLRNLYEDHIRAHMLAEEPSEEQLGDKDWWKAARKRAEETWGKPNLFGAMSLGKLFSITAGVARPSRSEKAVTFPEWLLEAARTPREEGAPAPFSWWGTEKHGVSRFAISSAFDALEQAFKVFYRVAATGRKAKKPRKDGRPDGWPRFKRFGDDDGFALFTIHQAGAPIEKLLPGGRQIALPSVGIVRVFGGPKLLRRAMQQGGVPKSARFTRVAGLWYVAINVTVPVPPERELTKKQRDGGLVGVDLGVNVLATVSDGRVFVNDRIGKQSKRKIERAAQRLSRTPLPRRGAPTTQGRKVARAKLAIAQHRDALRRQSRAHQLTKRLVSGYSIIGIEDLDLVGMVEQNIPEPIQHPEREGVFLPNGRELAATFNRELRDAAPGEVRRQLEYKAGRYGAEVVVVERFETTDRTCAACGHIQPKVEPRPKRYSCSACGFEATRGENSARVIAKLTREHLAARS